METSILPREQEDVYGRNGRNVAFVTFLGGARATTVAETYIAMTGPWRLLAGSQCSLL